MRIKSGTIKMLTVVLCIVMVIPATILLSGCTGLLKPPENIEMVKNGIKLTWSKVSDAKEYEILRGRSRLSAHVKIGTSNKLKYTDTSAFSNKYENYYTVIARDKNGKAITIGLTWDAYPNTAKYEIYRADSQDAEFNKIAEASAQVASVTVPEFYSRKPAVGSEGNVYRVVPLDAAGARFVIQGNEVIIENENITPVNKLSLSFEKKMFGENTLFYNARYDNIDAIREEINHIHDKYMYDSSSTRETGGQFSYRRYQFYFKPGNYEGLGDIKIGYYTSISGLGRLPTDTKLYANISTPAPLARGNATCTFWRSAENFEVNHVEEGDGTLFQWAVSQAAPMRRLSVNVPALFDWSNVYPNGGKTDGKDNSPWASGGFLSDSRFTDRLGSPNQQQWYTRNSHFEHSAYSGSNWNRVTQGVTGHPYENDWEKGIDKGDKTNIEKTPVVREKPFLYYDNGTYKVFVPALMQNSDGISWNDETNDMGKGVSLDLESNFFMAKTGDTAAVINAQLAGKHVFFTSGWYDLETPIHVRRENAVLLGSGYATVFPGQNNREGAIMIDDVPGVIVGSLMADAHYDSKYLVRVGQWGADKDHSTNPTSLSDVFLRVGGYMSTGVNANVSVQINSSDVIGDHLWVWRADHGNTVKGTSGAADYWHVNKGDFGLVVSGDRVSMYGLFVEHYQKYQTLWLGEHGRTYFYQNELPYDPPTQDTWMSHNGTVNGWSAYKVGNHVQNHYAIGLGSYGVFNRQFQGEREDPKNNESPWKYPPVYVFLNNAVEVPDAEGVKIEHIIITELGGRGGTSNIINSTGLSVGRDAAPPHEVITGTAVARRVVRYQNGSSQVKMGNSGPYETYNGIVPGDEDYKALLAGLTD